MEFRKILALRGPNVWATFTVLEAWLDLDDYKDASSEELPGFNGRVMTLLPSLVEHRYSDGARGGFFERLRRGTYLAHILEHVALELQSMAGSEVGFGRARATSEEGVFRVAVEYREEELGRAALEAARRFCLAAVHDRPFDVEAEVARLHEIHQRVALGPSTRSIVVAARRRGIPGRRLNQGSLIQLGHGAAGRLILASETDRTGAIAEWIAQDKEMTRELLAAVGVPVPVGLPVKDEEDAWAASQEIGPPVVVKPQHGNQGRGVATNLSTREQVPAAYEAAREEGSRIIVERFAPGDDHRILVVGDRMVAASLRRPARVRGDGRSTVAPLVEEVNLDPKRSDGHVTSLSKIHLDAIAMGVLKEQGLDPDSIPPDGAPVLIRRNANLSTGGTASDVTDCVHPDVAARAIEAARMVGLDVAGVDVMAADIGRPLEELAVVRRTIVEVVAPRGCAVLNAADPLVVAMADHCPGRVVYFARDGGEEVIAGHRAGGGRALLARDGMIRLVEGGRETDLASLDEVPMTVGGRIGFQVDIALAASAAAWSLGLPPEAIRAALRSFSGDAGQAPGQLNRIETEGATVIVDYGHNTGAVAALVDALAAFHQPRRTIAFTGAGDRRNADLSRQGTLLGDAFDRVVLYEDRSLRGRDRGEVIALLRVGLDSGVRVSQVAVARDEVDAIATALRGIGPGDLIVIQADESAERTLAVVRSQLASRVPVAAGPPADEIWVAAHPMQPMSPVNRP